MHKTDDVRISEIKELLPPIAVLEKFPASNKAAETVYQSRQAIHNILNEFCATLRRCDRMPHLGLFALRYNRANEYN